MWQNSNAEHKILKFCKAKFRIEKLMKMDLAQKVKEGYSRIIEIVKVRLDEFKKAYYEGIGAQIERDKRLAATLRRMNATEQQVNEILRLSEGLTAEEDPKYIWYKRTAGVNPKYASSKFLCLAFMEGVKQAKGIPFKYYFKHT